MNARGVALAIGALALAGLCGQLGFWQLERLYEKRRQNAHQRARMAAPPRLLRAESDIAGLAVGARVQLIGSYDRADQVLLSARIHAGEPGVLLVTPLRLEGDAAVLVQRGWLPADDSRTAVPPADTATTTSLLAIAEPIARGVTGGQWVALPAAPDRLWSAYQLDADTVRTRLPSVHAAHVFRALPEPGGPSYPIREAPEPANESMHMGYAVQWFGFAALLVVGAVGALLHRPAGARPPPAT